MILQVLFYLGFAGTLAIGALGHPKIYRLFFGGSGGSLDH